MLHEAELILAHGSKLDAWAAKISRNLGEQLPQYAVQLELNRLDELEHSRELAELSHEEVSNEYSTIVGGSAVSADPIWNALVLNLVEDRSAAQFAGAGAVLGGKARRTLAAIASDERRHITFGRTILAELNVPAERVEQALFFLNYADKTLRLPELDYKALVDLNTRCAQRLIANLKRV